MRQGVPDNCFNVCEELTFSRTFRKNSTERNKQDLNSQLSDIFITNQCYSLHIKDQGIVQMKLMPLLHVQHGSKSPEVDIANESNHDKNETRQKVPENEHTWMLCFSTAVSWPSFIFTIILLPKFSGP